MACERIFSYSKEIVKAQKGTALCGGDRENTGVGGHNVPLFICWSKLVDPSCTYLVVPLLVAC